MKAKLLSLAALAWLASIQVTAQTVIFSEDFQGPLTGWLQNTSASDGGWSVGDSALINSADFHPPAHTLFAGTNDDGCNCNKLLDRLIAPVQDFTDYSCIYLEADVYFLENSDGVTTESAFIDVSTDNGFTWTVVHTLTGSTVWNRLTVDLSAYGGMANVMIGFHYSDKGVWLWGFCVDDVELHTMMTVTPSPVSCFGSSDGTISLTTSAVGAPYTYLWSNGDTSQNLVGLSPGTYSVVVTDVNGCTAEEDSVTISGPPVWTLDLNNKDVSCFEESDGSIDLTVSGGTAPYTYLWSNGDTTEDISGLTADTYEVTVAQSDSCVLIDSMVMTEPEQLITNIISQDESGGGASDGSVDLTVTGGTPPYSFFWSNSETTEDISGLPSGTYTVTILDSNSCTASDTALILTTSIKSLQSKNSELTIFPNPTDGQFTIRFTDGLRSPIKIKIWNLQGQMIVNKALPSSNSAIVNMTDHSAGLYFLQITTDVISMIKKIVLE